MKHLFLIDSPENLVISKDSSLLWALSLKERGEYVRLLFRENLTISTLYAELEVCDFFGSIGNGTIFFIENFALDGPPGERIRLGPECIIYMRLDPPIDLEYLEALWKLEFLRSRFKVRVSNHPVALAGMNEKLLAFALAKRPLPSYIGPPGRERDRFIKDLIAKGVKDFIAKPLDLFQGRGVRRFSSKEYLAGKIESEGGLIYQPFYQDIFQGEVRALFFQGEFRGAILKRPAPGGFLTNIAQGGSYEAIDLKTDDPKIFQECEVVAQSLLEDGIDLIAFDVMGDALSEANITCPGLLVEMSNAFKRNLCQELIF